MKFVPAIFLLFFLSLVGCSPQPDQQVAESGTNSEAPEVAGPATTETDKGESTGPASSEPEKAGEPEKEPASEPPAPNASTQNAEVPTGNDPATTQPESATQKSETPAEEPKPKPKPKPKPEPKPEPKPATWLERARFFDIANRVIEDRNKEPIKLDEKSMKEMIVSVGRLDGFIERLAWLHDMLALRQRLIESKFIDRQLVASIRGEISLPEGTLERRNKLRGASLPNLGGLRGILAGMDRAIMENRLRKGDLFRLAVALRGSYADFVTMRKLEIQQDEFLLTFPTMRLRASEEFSQMKKDWPYWPNETVATARELWADVPAKRKKRFGYDYELPTLPDQISTSFDPKDSGRTAFRVLSEEEFSSIRELTKEIERLSGGPEPLLVFPESTELPSRKRLIEASKRNLDVVRKADLQAIRDLRLHLIEGFDERDKEMYQDEDDESEEERQKEFDYLLSRGNLSEYGFVSMIDLAFQLKPDWSKVFEAARTYFPKKYEGFVNKHKKAGFFEGAKYYFDKESK